MTTRSTGDGITMPFTDKQLWSGLSYHCFLIVAFLHIAGWLWTFILPGGYVVPPAAFVAVPLHLLAVLLMWVGIGAAVWHWRDWPGLGVAVAALVLILDDRYLHINERYFYDARPQLIRLGAYSTIAIGAWCYWYFRERHMCKA